MPLTLPFVRSSISLASGSLYHVYQETSPSDAWLSHAFPITLCTLKPVALSESSRLRMTGASPGSGSIAYPDPDIQFPSVQRSRFSRVAVVSSAPPAASAWADSFADLSVCFRWRQADY